MPNKETKAAEICFLWIQIPNIPNTMSYMATSMLSLPCRNAFAINMAYYRIRKFVKRTIDKFSMWLILF